MYFIEYIDNLGNTIKKNIVSSLKKARKKLLEEQDFYYYRKFVVNKKYNRQVGRSYFKGE